MQGEIVVQLRAQVYDKLQRLSFRFFDEHASGSIINRVTGDVQSLRSFVDLVLVQVFITLIQFLLAFAYMVAISAPLTLACFLTTPLLAVGAVWFSRLVRPAYVRNRELVDNMIGVLSESVQGAAVIKGFAREREEIAKFAAANREVRDQQRWIFWRLSTFIPALGFLAQVNLIVLLAYGGALVMRGRLPLGSGLVVFAGLLQLISNQILRISDIANSVQTSLTGARRVFEVLDTPIEITSPDPVCATPLPRARGDVRFENVHFDYKKEHSVLRGVDFHIAPGTCVAILGPTGSGKSALLSLIPRFYDPSQGCVLIDGHDVRCIELDDLRRNIGLVFQENFLFPTRWRRTSRSASRRPRPRRSSAQRGWRRRTISSARCHRATGRSWAKRRPTSRAGSGSGWRLRGRSCWNPRSCCWTIRRRRSIRAPNTRSFPRWTARCGGGRLFWWHTGSARCNARTS